MSWGSGVNHVFAHCLWHNKLGAAAASGFMPHHKKNCISVFAREILVYVVEDLKLVAKAVKYKQVRFIAEQDKETAQLEWTQVQINAGQGITWHVMEVSLQRLHVEHLVWSSSIITFDYYYLTECQLIKISLLINFKRGKI